jgi:hypothetical protein
VESMAKAMEKFSSIICECEKGFKITKDSIYIKNADEIIYKCPYCNEEKNLYGNK